METHAYGLTRSRARQSRAQAHPKRGDYRQPVRENQGNRGARGYDSGKKVNGRKRHLLVDTTGLILSVLVHEANIQDYTGGKRLLCPLKQCFPRLRLIWADGAYKKGGFVEWVKATLGWEVEIVEHPWSGLRGVWARHPMRSSIGRRSGRADAHVLPHRWIVERTFAWLSTWRSPRVAQRGVTHQ